MKRAALFLFLAGCPHGQLDARLVARVPPETPAYAPDGSLRFHEFTVDHIALPRVEEEPNRNAPSVIDRHLRYRYTLHAPEGDLATTCEVGGQGGSLMTDAHAYIECHAGENIVIMEGYGDTDFLELRVANGVANGPEYTHPTKDPRVPTFYTQRLRLTGSATAWNFLASQEHHHLDADGQWRSACCDDGQALAAAALRPPRVYLDPALRAPLRTEAALGIAALLVLRDVRHLDGVLE